MGCKNTVFAEGEIQMFNNQRSMFNNQVGASSIIGLPFNEN